MDEATFVVNLTEPRWRLYLAGLYPTAQGVAAARRSKGKTKVELRARLERLNAADLFSLCVIAGSMIESPEPMRKAPLAGGQ